MAAFGAATRQKGRRSASGALCHSKKLTKDNSGTRPRDDVQPGLLGRPKLKRASGALKLISVEEQHAAGVHSIKLGPRPLLNNPLILSEIELVRCRRSGAHIRAKRCIRPAKSACVQTIHQLQTKTTYRTNSPGKTVN